MSYGDGTVEESIRRAAALIGQFGRTGERAPLDTAVALCRTALDRESTHGHLRTSGLQTLRTALVMRWWSFRHRPDLDESIDAGRLLAAGSAPRVQDLRLLGCVLADRFGLDRNPADRDTAIRALGKAAERPADGTEQQPLTLDSLGSLLAERAEETGSAAEMAEGVRLLRQALSLLLDEDPRNAADIAAVRNNLAVALGRASCERGTPSAPFEAVELLRAVVAATPPHAPRYAPALLQLAEALRRKAGLTEEAADLKAMVAVARAAHAATPAGHREHPWGLAVLGVALRLAAEHTEGTGLLDESVELLRASVRSTDRADRSRPHRLNSLGNALHRLGERTGEMTLLDEAVGHLREAVEESSPDEPDHFGRVANLALVLRERYHQSGDLTTLRESAGLARLALRFPRSSSDSDSKLANLGVILQTWYDRTADAAAASEAVEAARQVLDRTPDDSADLALRLNHLGNALHKRYESEADPADLDESIAVLTRAVAETAYGEPEHASHLQNLGLAQLTRARATEDESLLNRAVATLGRAVYASPTGAARTAGYLQSYAAALRTLHAANADPAVLRAAEGAYRQVAVIQALPAAQRIGAARDWGEAAADGGRWEEAVAGYELALALLPFSITGRLPRGDQEHRLAGVQGLAADAAACAVRLGRPDRAVLLLEQGRGVLLGRTIAARAELKRLRAVHPEAAGHLAQVRDRIDALGSEIAEQEAAGPGSDARHILAARWERLVGEIRALPGFEGFLGAPAYDEVLACAEGGPVVLVYSSAYRSDALVLRPEGVCVVPLPRVTPEAVAEQVARLEAALTDATAPTGERSAQQAVEGVLAWTWDAVAEPVLDRLGLLAMPADGDWPRLWWSPVGALAALPLHAAGHHGEPPDPRPRTVLDLVVSSYTPTVRALAYARQRAVGRQADGGLLAVVVPDAPGTRALGGVRREVRELSALLPTEVVAGPRATFANVLRALPAHPYVHFACHGVSDPGDPSQARLLVHDHQEHPLTVQHISGLELPDARLAVLSACETARGSERLADESIHITSAFQIAGYPHVIGTLWPVHDAVAGRVASSLYRQLRGDRTAGSWGLDADQAALALHRAVRQCRTAFRGSPSLWGAHVHSGA
ncbi:CHAT domain-containing protein [Streptomyces sp. H39-S7]|uniref:CHAT domain-containing protein n=1 Tax=Streptomyces sp. H39-S7 TaxID=3004357 RepID=UPI0022AFEB53|nr:CHAT domain-containing protein [Streptomyces sp. H39-S7]MCZ4120310.1 CHAT domain-containing protein [Streptomyces sp. H39-S7]